MYLLKLILRNALRHKLRTLLTVLGLLVAILSFGLLQTVVDAWYTGANSAAPDRLVTRSAVSLVVPLPVHYRDKIRAIDGVRSVASANWFAGVYQEPKNIFPQFAIDAVPYLAMYPEFLLPEEQYQAWLKTRTGAIVGRSTATRFGFKIGDKVPIQATFWVEENGSRTWEFDIVGIYDGAAKGTTPLKTQYQEE